MGETDYKKLSSNLGACYYPAGHIWHYIPVVLVHKALGDFAVPVMKLVHAAVHSLTLVYVTRTAYIYFDNKLKA